MIGVEEVTITLERMRNLAGNAAEDERMAKDVKKREQEERSNSQNTRKKNSSGIIPDREWTEAEYKICREALARYHPGQPSRWQSIYCYVMDKAKPTEVLSQDELLRACYRAATYNY
jgi:hypothetical protein